VSGFVLSEKPIEIERGDGVHLYGADGTAYLDAGASYACAPAGHGHPAVVDAVTEQAAELLYVQGSYPVAARTDLYERLAALAPAGLGNAWLCNSGAEANEAALKFARSATEGTEFVAARSGFHGRTMGALSATWKPKYRAPYEPLVDAVTFVDFDDPEALAAAVTDDTAAVLLEPIQGEGGVNPASVEYLQTAREVTDDHAAALVFDEVQTGLGRTGTLWACEAAGVTPDVLTTAKGLASGLPMGATLCADWVADGAASHGSTFSGSPVVSAAAEATLDAIVDETLPDNAAAVGSYLAAELAAAGLDVRGEGLMLGVDVGPSHSSRVLKTLALEHQVLALPAGRSTVRLLPPLTLDEDDADQVIDALATVLGPREAVG
jgi:acetylornithine/LysW-gamma-L-lysine aminotransferase